jgi:hypothetical protein
MPFLKHALLAAALASLAPPLPACHDGSPLILDLNGDGILTSDLWAPVNFDLDGDGVSELIAWTRANTEEGLLALDLDGDGQISSGRELFGDATLLPDGDRAANGFLALAVWDKAEMGGDGNGRIDDDDLIWVSLRIWIDANHDGASQPEELSTLTSRGVLSLQLDYSEEEGRDASGNSHRFQSTFERRVERRWGSPYVKTSALHDIYFQIAHLEDPPP